MFKYIFSLFTGKLDPTKTPTSLEGFEQMEALLKGMRAQPRPAFKQALQSKLRARYEELQIPLANDASPDIEDRLSNLLAAFRIPKWATATAVIVLMVGGSTLVGASPAPRPQAKPFGNMETGEQLDFAPITLTFDQPMMMSSVENAFHIEPAIEGHFVWNGRKEVSFIPSGSLDPEVTYTVTLSEGARSLLQKRISTPYQQTLQVQHVELTEEAEARLEIIQELRETEDRPLTPQEKKILHEKFLEMEMDFPRAVHREAEGSFRGTRAPKPILETETESLVEVELETGVEVEVEVDVAAEVQ